ncbi:MAG: hypothetical protein LBE24_06755 [Methylobacillus sp.]|jgi:hypothetical protein|nr:hypothetical protein [Methylobacillus sp.]
METDDLLKESTVYAFHVPSTNSIKVGFGADGRTRMKNYSRQYALSSSAVSLREWKLPSPSLASSIESACHRALLSAGFYRVSHVVDEREAKELFDLGHHSYEEAVIVVAEAIEETINSLHAALGKLKPLSQEKARQQKDEAQRRRSTLCEEKKVRKEEDENRLINSAIPEIRQRWEKDVAPFTKACDNARVIWKQFSYSQGFISSILNGRQSAAFRMRNWQQWPSIKRLIPEIFHSGRRAKSAYLDMKKRYGDYAEKAAHRLGLSLWRPGGHDLTLVGCYPDKDGMAFLEVRLVVQEATGFGGDDAEEIIKCDLDLFALVKFAEQNPAPELGAPRQPT